MRMSALRRAVLLLPLLAGCEWPTESRLPAGVVEFAAPAVYAKWWNLTESCSGRSGAFWAVRWYVLPNATSIPSQEGPGDAVWYRASNAIVFVPGAQREGDVVRHEMLHALLRSRTGGHDRTEFLERCRGVVACVGVCIADGGAPPPDNPAAVPKPPTVLDIGVDVTPATPGSATEGGNFMMIVTAHNPLDSAIDVELPPSGDSGPSVSFSYELARAGGSFSWDQRADVPEDSRFGPHETKRFLFDFRVELLPSRYGVPSGTYSFRGAYGGVWAPKPPTVTVGP